MTTDTETPESRELPEGMIEERVQVDRRRLEKMITQENLNGDSLPKAEEFFEKVEKESGATVSWPTRLKIGAKTKKDPYVKVMGFPDQVQIAKDRICELLKIKRDRVTMKMEICHNSHSHIIGRGGQNTKRVMAETQCHIHFPDSNKHSDIEKNNQVSIAGSIDQVEKAREQLRLISPVSMSFSIYIGERPTLNIGEIQRALLIPEVNLNQQSYANGAVQYQVKGSIQHKEKMIEAIIRIHQLYGVTSFSELVCSSSFELRPALLQPSYGLFHHNNVSWIALQTNTNMQFSPRDPVIIISGHPQGIFRARSYLTGLLPISIQIEKPLTLEIPQSTKTILEKEHEVAIVEKRKSPGHEETMIVIRSYEANVKQIYETKRHLMDPNYKSERNEMSPTANEMSAISRLTELYNQIALTQAPYPAFRTISELNLTTSHISQSAPKSPDPKENPIAHSLFSTAKKSELENWRQPNNNRVPISNRDQLLLLANRATYTQDLSPDVRQPTSLWAGYGFSNSLPADILKLGLQDSSMKSGNQQNFFENSTDSRQFQTSQNLESSRAELRPIVGRGASEFENSRMSLMASTNKGLASVREEEEFSDYNHSHSSNFEASPSATPSQNPTQFPLPRIFKKPAFTASTSVFESGPPISNDFSWDLKTFADPAMVLAQLGCSEYLPQFRDQEIDMQAFLLLDEQNLKDIGVSTMGARKKIFNAILKLRDSAVKYGFEL